MVACTAVLLAAAFAGPAAQTDPARAAELITVPYPVPDLTGGDAAALPKLAEQIVAATDPKSWRPPGGRGVISPSETTMALVVRQTRAVHEQISGFLTERRRRLRMAEVRCVLVELPGATGKPAAEVRDVVSAAAGPASGPVVLTDDAAVQRAVGAAALRYGVSVLSRPTVRVLNDQTATVQVGAGSDDPDGGWALTCRPHLDARGDAVSLSATLRRGPAAPAAGPGRGDAVRVPTGGSVLLLCQPDGGAPCLAVLTPTAVDGSPAGD